MWLKGFVYGFITKPKAEQLLQQEKPGTFIVRFSERRPGKVTVAYSQVSMTGGANEVHHYMIDPHDKKDSSTLAEFLHSKENLLYLMQLSTDFTAQGVHRIKKRLDKQVVLRDFLGKRSGNSPIDGYDPDM